METTDFIKLFNSDTLMAISVIWLSLSETLPFFKKIKSNSILQLIWNIIKTLVLLAKPIKKKSTITPGG